MAAFDLAIWKSSHLPREVHKWSSSQLFGLIGLKVFDSRDPVRHWVAVVRSVMDADGCP